MNPNSIELILRWIRDESSTTPFRCQAEVVCNIVAEPVQLDSFRRISENELATKSGRISEVLKRSFGAFDVFQVYGSRCAKARDRSSEMKRVSKFQCASDAGPKITFALNDASKSMTRVPAMRAVPLPIEL